MDARRTFRLDRFRGSCHGILETGTQTFLLLVAIRVFEAGPTAKALLVAAHPIGLVLTPLSLYLISRTGLPAATACSFYFFTAAALFAGGAWLGHAGLFLTAMISAGIALAQFMPLLVSIYSRNYPSARRGQLLSQSILLSVTTAIVFSFVGGRLLDADLGHYPWVITAMAAAAFFSGLAVRRMPSAPLIRSASRNPLASLTYAWKDRVFGGLLVIWMLMGLGNLLVLPLRIEYMANPDFGINATNAEIAFITVVVPSLMRFATTHFWGILFDRFNFFLLRTLLNVFFLVAIVMFFHVQTLGLLAVASAFFGLALAGGNIAWSLWVTKFAPPGKEADYMAVHTFSTGLRGVVAPFLGFYAITLLSPSATSIIAGGLVALSIILILPLRRRAEG
ncbi:MAG: MFS transporter [Puniceicoccaceae bacterium]|nr:MAG: MFS transporter [Puniceicoccaceae bacterium]